MRKINIKPLSVNECWQGQRFKTKEYKQYEKDVLLTLPKLKICDAPYQISIEFAFSSTLADIDNPLKPFLDILQKKYNINDRDVYKLNVAKTVVKKGFEYIRFNIERYEKQTTDKS
jgi:Holliday junction resolvase RusA-like endonuclease